MTIADLTTHLRIVLAQADSMNPELLAMLTNHVMGDLREHIEVCSEFHAFATALLRKQEAQANEANPFADDPPDWVLDDEARGEVDDFDLELWMRGVQ